MIKNVNQLFFVTLFTVSLTSLSAQNNRFYKSWLGEIKLSGVQLRIAFHISEHDGIIITKMDSPDQNSFGNPAHKTIINSDTLKIDFPLMGAKYEGVLKNETVEGIFSQSGMDLPLHLHQYSGELNPPKRPQVPVGPFPYSEKEVTIKTPNEKVKLSGTLTLPQGKGPFPAVVLISGSGPQDRNEELMGHKPFLVLADHLSRNGIAVLRYDDRGVGKSTGNFALANSIDFADDAEAAWNFLSRQKKVNKSKVGFIGHSEGGLIAPIVAARNKQIGFIILMAGPSVPGRLIIPDQQELIMKASETDGKEIKEQVRLTQLVLDYITQHATSSDLQQDLAVQIELWVKEMNYTIPQTLSIKSFARQTAHTYTTEWMKTFIITSPADYLIDVNCPVLALFGKNDLQVSPRLNEEPMRQLLQHQKNSEVYTFPGLNHLFQTSDTGAPGEYALIEETLSPLVLEYIQKWIAGLK